MRAWILPLLVLLSLIALPVNRLRAREHTAAAPEVAAPEGAPHEAHIEPELLRSGSEGLITAITTFIVFLLLVVILGRTAWGPITKGLKSREDKIRNDISVAESARTKAEATLAEYNAKLAAAQEQIRQLLSTASADAERLAMSIRMKAQTESEEIKERAQKEIESAKDAALGEIYAQTAELSTSIAEKILRRSINADDQRELVRQSLEQLQTIRSA